MKLGIWKKPNSNEIRVYFNGLYDAEMNGLKVFAVERPDISGYEVKFSGGAYQSLKDSIIDRIDDELCEMNGGERVISWSNLSALAY